MDDALVRVMDLVAAWLLLFLICPLLIVIATLILISNPGPVFFRQRRIGYGGQRFYCYKFRTMVTDAEALLAELLSTDEEAAREWQRDHKLKRDPRISGVGRFLRKSSLDELPQLLNVPKGEMSLVGPRPIADAEICKYGRYFAAYCRVKPAIGRMRQIGSTHRHRGCHR